MVGPVRSLFDLSLQLQHSGQRQLQILPGVRLLYKHRLWIYTVKLPTVYALEYQ